MLLGELKCLYPIMTKSSGPRVPREAEIWQLQISRSPDPWKRKFFGTFTARTQQPSAEVQLVPPHTPPLERSESNLAYSLPPQEPALYRGI